MIDIQLEPVVARAGAPVWAFGVATGITFIGLAVAVAAGAAVEVAVTLVVTVEQPLSVATTATPITASLPRIALPGSPPGRPWPGSVAALSAARAPTFGFARRSSRTPGQSRDLGRQPGPQGVVLGAEGALSR